MAVHQYTSPSGAVYEFEGPDELTPELAKQIQDTVALNESDTNQGPLATFGNAAVQGAAQTVTGTVGGAGAVLNTLTGNTGEDRSALSQWADEMQRGTELNFPTNPANPVATGLGQAVGQGVGMMGTSALGLPLANARTVAGLGLGMAGLMGAQQGEQTADEFGVTDPLKRAGMVAGFGAAEALSESIGGIGSTKFAKSLLKDVPSVLETGIETSALKRGIKTASGEALEEPISGELQDITTRLAVEEDPNRPGYALNGQPLPELLGKDMLLKRGEEALYGLAGGAVPGAVHAAIGTDAGDVMEYRQAVAEKRRDGKVLPEEEERVSQLDAKAQEYLRKAGFSDEDQASQILAHLQRADKTREIVVEAAEKAEAVAPSVSEALNEILQDTDRDAVLKDVDAAVQAIEPKPADEQAPTAKPSNKDAIIRGVEKIKANNLAREQQLAAQAQQEEELQRAIEEERAKTNLFPAPSDTLSGLTEAPAETDEGADVLAAGRGVKAPRIELPQMEGAPPLEGVPVEIDQANEPVAEEEALSDQEALAQVIADERARADQRENKRLLEEVIADERTKAEQREATPDEPIPAEETPEPVTEQPTPEPVTGEPFDPNKEEEEKTVFSPNSRATLTDRSSDPDVPVKLGSNRPPIAGGSKEGDILSPEKRKAQFDSVGYTSPNETLPEDFLSRVTSTYGSNVAKIKSLASLSFDGAFYKGAIVLNEGYVNPKLKEPGYRSRVVAHELGHASHALLGDLINKSPVVAEELKAVEKKLYPGLRQKVQSAKKADHRFFNYLLSADELIAEFNVFRLSNPVEARQLAPVLARLLASVEKSNNLVRPRNTFPTDFRGFTRTGEFIQVKDLTTRRSSKRAPIPVTASSLLNSLKSGHKYLAAFDLSKLVLQGQLTIEDARILVRKFDPENYDYIISKVESNLRKAAPANGSLKRTDFSRIDTPSTEDTQSGLGEAAPGVEGDLMNDFNIRQAEPVTQTYEPEPVPEGATLKTDNRKTHTPVSGEYTTLSYKDSNGRTVKRAYFTNDPAQTFKQIAAGLEIPVPNGIRVHPSIEVKDGKVLRVKRVVNGVERWVSNQQEAYEAARDDRGAAQRSEAQRPAAEKKKAATFKKKAERVSDLPPFPEENSFVTRPLLDRIKAAAASIKGIDTVARDNLETDILSKLVTIKRVGAFVDSMPGETTEQKKQAALSSTTIKGNKELEGLVKKYNPSQEDNLSYIAEEVWAAKAASAKSVQTASLDDPDTGVTTDVAAPVEEETVESAELEEATRRLEGVPEKFKEAILSDPNRVALINDMSEEALAKFKAQLAGAKADRIKAGYRSVRSIMEETNRLGLKDGQPGSILTALQRIAENKTGDNYHPHIVYVARALSQLTGSLSMIQDLRFSTANALHAASYRASDHSIALNMGTPWGESQSVGEVLVHEVGHALTSIKLNDPQTEYDKALAAEIETMRQQISDYLTNVRPDEASRFAYQLSNADEFVAGVFSNPPFVEMLATLPERLVAGTPSATKGNFLTKLLRKLWNLMLGKSVTPGAPLDRAMDAVFNLAETPFTIPTVENVLQWAGIEKNFPAYHGTPHTFDRFNTDKIGTGEGAQAYGWGLYFAQNREVGEMYRDTVTDAKKERLPKLKDALTFWQQFITDAPTGSQTQEQWQDDRAKAESKIAKIEAQIADLETSGNLYTVEILPDESEFLDWNKLVTEQSPAVIDKLKKAGIYFETNEYGTPAKGEYIYHHKDDSARNKSRRLLEAGIPGIKYLDAGSRNKDGGTRNFVVFDDNDVKITHANGTPVTEQERKGVLDQHLNAGRSEYQIAVERGDSGNDNLAQALRAAPREDRARIVNEWMQRNPESARRLQAAVDEAAKKAGYTEGPLWHWTKADESFDVFDLSKSPEGFHFGTEWAAQSRARELRNSNQRGTLVKDGRFGKFYLKGRPVDVDDLEENHASSLFLNLESRGTLKDESSGPTSKWSVISASEAKEDLRTKRNPRLEAEDREKVTRVEKAVGRSLGHPMSELDRMLGGQVLFRYTNNTEDKGSVSYSVANPNQIKSADPVTFDENGEIIPPEQRFDLTKDSILYSSSTNSTGVDETEHRSLLTEALTHLPEGYVLNTSTDSASPMWVKRSQPGVIYVNPAVLAAEVAGLNEKRRGDVLRAIINEEVAHTEDMKELGDDEVRKIAREFTPETRQFIEDMYGSKLSDVELVFEGFRMLRQRVKNGATTEEVRAFAASDPNFARRFLEYLRRMYRRLVAAIGADKTLANVAAARSLIGGIESLENLAAGEDTELHSEMDTAYLAAVDAKDYATAQRMVEEAAKTAGYKRRVFHGTASEFTKFRTGVEYGRQFKPNDIGAWFATSKNLADAFASDRAALTGGEARTMNLFIKLDNPKVFQSYGQFLRDTEGRRKASSYKNWLLSEGYDGVEIRNSVTDTGESRTDFVAFAPSQIKSADPVTYDEQGNVIPLSQRFNQDSDSILSASPWAWIRDQLKTTTGTVTSHTTRIPWFATRDANTPYTATGTMFGSGRKNVAIAEAERIKNAAKTAEGRALTVLDRDIKNAAIKTMGSWDKAKALVGEALGNNDNRMDYNQRKQYERDHTAALKTARAAYQSSLGTALALENKGDYAQAASVRQSAQAKFKTDVNLANDDFNHKVEQAEQLVRQQALAKQAAAMAALPTELRDAVQKARDRMDALTTEFINKGYGSDDLRATLSKNLGLYLHRSYSAFDSPHWSNWVMGSDPEAVRLRNKVETLIKTDLVAQKAAALIKANPNLSQQAAITQAQGLVNDNEIEAGIQDLLKNSPDEFTAMLQGGGVKTGQPSSVLKRRGEIHPWIQEFWGKYDDPLLNISKSIGLTHAYLAQQSMMHSIISDGRANGYIFDDRSKAKGLEPLKVMNEENKRRYPSLFRKNAKGEIIGEWYVSPLVRDAIADLDPKQSGMEDNFLSKAWNVFRSLTGYSMAAKTVYSPMALVRDFLSNITLLTIHGHMTPGFSAGLSTWSKSLAANAREVGLDKMLSVLVSPVKGKGPLFTSAQMKMLDTLLHRSDELGITGNQMTTSVIKELIGDNSKRFETRGRDYNALLKALNSGLQGTAERFMNARALSDDIPKLVAWVNETLRVSRFHPNMTQEQAEEAAARKVRMVMPTYSETSDLIKVVRKQPFVSPFVTFSGEIVRTMVNTYRLGAEEMRSNSVAEKILGFHRIGLMTAMITVLPALIQSAISKFRPEDDPPVKTDELDTALPRFVSGWQKENMLLWLGKEGNKHTYLDLSYLAPYDVIHGILNGTARELFTNPDNVTVPDKVASALEKAFDEATKPVAKEQLLTGAIIDTMRNQREPGDKFGLYNDKLATGWEKWTASLGNIWQQALEPGIVKSARGILKGFNQEIDSSGRAYELGNEIRSLFGAKTMSQDIPTRLTRNGNGYARDLADATMYASQPFTSAGTQDDESLIKSFARMNEAKLKIAGEIRKDWLAAQALGMTAEEASKSLAISALPKDILAYAIKNEYVREPLSKQMLEKAAANGRTLGQDRMALYRRALESYPPKQKVLNY